MCKLCAIAALTQRRTRQNWNSNNPSLSQWGNLTPQLDSADQPSAADPQPLQPAEEAV